MNAKTQRDQRLRELRREIGILLDEANLLSDDLSAEERHWIESMLDTLQDLDAAEAATKKGNQSSD